MSTICNKCTAIFVGVMIILVSLILGQIPVYAAIGWSEDICISNTTESSMHPTMAIDLYNNVYLTWVEGPVYGSGWHEDIYYAKLDKYGTIITPAKRLSFSGWQFNSSLAVDSNNNLHIAWENWMGPAWMEELFHRVIYASGNVGNGTQMTSTPSRCNTDTPHLAIDTNNNLHLVYQDEVNDPIDGDQNVRRDLFYKKFAWDGATLTQLVGPIELTTADGIGYPYVGHVNDLGGMVLDKNGNVHIVWADWRDYSSYNYTEIYYTKLDNAGKTLVDDVRLTPVDGFRSTSPTLTVDSNNNIHVFWTDARDGNDEIYYTKIDSNGNTVVDDTRITVNTSSSINPSVAADSTDKIHVIWSDKRDGNFEVYYTKLDKTGNKVEDDVRVTTANGDSIVNNLASSIRLDAEDKIHIVWQDNRDGNWETYYKYNSNIFPLANAGTDQIVNCAGANGAAVTLDGSGSSDPDGDALTYTWTGVFGTVTGVNPVVQMPLGTNTVTLKADDGKGGTAEDTVVITVQDIVPPSTSAAITGTSGNNGWYKSEVNVSLASADNCSGVKEIHYTLDGVETVVSGSATGFTISADGTHSLSFWAVDNANNLETAHPATINIDKTAPVLNITVTPGLLWPPNHKMVNITPLINVSDNLTGNVQVELISVTSSEPDNGLGDGDTANDIVGNADGTISLRAERSGAGNGRVYTITYKATDLAGNITVASATVVVPHDMGKK